MCGSQSFKDGFGFLIHPEEVEGRPYLGTLVLQGLTLPTVILFSGGEPRETVIGPRPKQHFERVFEPHLAAG